MEADLFGTMCPHGTPQPSVFSEARVRIGAAGYTVRESASYASAVYSGVFCLLGLHRARDWYRGEAIQLQNLQDHHIFPRAYLKRHGITSQADVNSIINRTLISDETNNKIADDAPADYLARADVLPSGPEPTILTPHFLTTAALEAMQKAAESVSNTTVSVRYEVFRRAREAAIVATIREVCGVVPLAAGTDQRMDDAARQPAPELIVLPDRPTADDIWHMLTRIPIPPGQQQLYRALYDAGDAGVPGTELPERMGRSVQEVPGILGALGSRINQTDGLGTATKPGIGLVFDIQRLPGGQWHYRMLPETRATLEALDPPWLRS